MNQVSMASMMGIALVAGILLASLGSKRIYLLIILMPILIMLLGIWGMIISMVLKINYVWAGLICVFVGIGCWYFSLEFPITAELRNKEYIEWFECEKLAREVIKENSSRREDFEDFTDDPMDEAPQRISGLKQTINRMIFFSRDVAYRLNYYFEIIVDYFRWSYGAGGDLKNFNAIYGISVTTNLKHKRPDEISEDVKFLIENMNSCDEFRYSYLLSIVAYFVLFDFILENFLYGWTWIFIGISIGLLVLLAVVFQKMLRRYVGGENAKFNIFMKYQEKLFSQGKIIGISLNENNMNKLWWRDKVSIVALDHIPGKKGIMQYSDKVKYLIIKKPINFKTLSLLLPVIKNEERLAQWLEIVDVE